MSSNIARFGAGWLVSAIFVAGTIVHAEDASRRTIEEIVVTAEKRESTVQDTAIAITAFSDEFLENFGIRSQEDLQNYTPSTTIQPYDVTIRGVGRNFRTLGGDPGVSTYVNGVYSEDFGIASTENALYDIERIEILRGPQGTLYGRNAIGGAVNFLSKKPTQDWQGEVRSVVGEFDANELYGFISGPIVEDVLAFRVNGAKARRDGSAEDNGGFTDLAKGDDQNVQIALQFTPNEQIEVNVRYNNRHFVGDIGGQTAYISEGVGLEDKGQANTSIYAQGLCRIPVVTSNPLGANTCLGFAAPLPAPPPGAIALRDPATGETAYAMRVRPGIDIAAGYRPSSLFQHVGSEINGSGNARDMEAEVDTNGLSYQAFDQSATTFELAYHLNDGTSIKYIYGYNEFDYTFDLDADRTSSTNGDFTFRVLEEVYTYSHELQLLWDFGDSVTTTTGLYYFKSGRDQRLDFFDPLVQGRFTQPAFYGPLAPFIGPLAGLSATPVTLGSASKGASIAGPWGGDDNGTFFQYDNANTTDAYAAYTQAEWQINDQFALTLGVRWSKDEKEVTEDRFGYFELNPAAFGLDLFTYNAVTGAISFFGVPTCALTDQTCQTPLRLQGIPLSFADNGFGEDDWTETTWRVNLDWTPTDNHLVYLSATTGYRSGGYNLGLRNCYPGSAICELQPYDAETVLAYEIGSKSELLDRRLQVNLSAYLYDYEEYQDRVNGIDPLTGQAVDVVQNAPQAENWGIEVESNWLATDAWMIGGNYSYAKTEYTESYLASNEDDPASPRSIFGPRQFDVEGNELNRIPRHKVTVYTNYSWATSVGRFDFYTTVAWEDRQYYTPFNLDIDRAPDFYRWDGRVEWTSTDERLSVAAYCNNITDELGVRDLGTNAEGSNWVRSVTQTYPRFWALDVRYKWGG